MRFWERGEIYIDGYKQSANTTLEPIEQASRDGQLSA